MLKLLYVIRCIITSFLVICLLIFLIGDINLLIKNIDKSSIWAEAEWNCTGTFALWFYLDKFLSYLAGEGDDEKS